MGQEFYMEFDTVGVWSTVTGALPGKTHRLGAGGLSTYVLSTGLDDLRYDHQPDTCCGLFERLALASPWHGGLGVVRLLSDGFRVTCPSGQGKNCIAFGDLASEVT